MDKVYDLIVGGALVTDACEAAGVKRKTYEQWRSRYPEWRARLDRARVRATEDERPTAPFDSEFRATYMNYGTPPHMQQMMDVINNLASGEWGGIWVPPGHAKSAVVEDFVCHQVAMNPDVRIFYISKTQARAIKSVGLLQERMTNRGQFEEYISTFGPFKAEGHSGRPWTATHFTVARKTADHREYTVEGLGIGGQLTGSRADIIILDDVADVDNQSAGEIDKQYEWVFKVAQTRLVEGGKVIVIGTRMKEEDLYSRLVDEGFFDQTLTLPAILREPGTLDEDDPGEFLWPEGPVSNERLLKIRTRDPRMFELIYQQNPMPSVGAVFPYDQIEACFNDKVSIGQVPSGTRVVVGIDPAVTGYTAGVVFAVDVKTGLRYLVDVWNEANLTGDGGDHHAGLIQFITELCSMYNASEVCIESNSAFKLLTNSMSLRDTLFRMGVNMTTYVSGGQGSTTGDSPEDLAVAQLSSLFSNRMIVIPYFGQARGIVKPFVDQFVRWRPGDKKLIRDIVKATQMAEHAAKRILQRSNFNPPPPKLPPYLQKRRERMNRIAV